MRVSLYKYTHFFLLPTYGHNWQVYGKQIWYEKICM